MMRVVIVAGMAHVLAVRLMPGMLPAVFVAGVAMVMMGGVGVVPLGCVLRIHIATPCVARVFRRPLSAG